MDGRGGACERAKPVNVDEWSLEGWLTDVRRRGTSHPFPQCEPLTFAGPG
jgi:hypothetical protein